MSYVSYSEDILKKHESDVFDLLRELEQGQVSELRQRGALPEFQTLVQELGSLLSDPAQPAAMRLLNLRQSNERLSFDLARANEKIANLGATNTSLNEEKLHLTRDLRQARDEARSIREKSANQQTAANGEIARLENDRNQLQQTVEDLKRRVGSLEVMALKAQVDRQY